MQQAADDADIISVPDFKSETKLPTYELSFVEDIRDDLLGHIGVRGLEKIRHK
jgi:hypothetical protein